MIKSEGKTPIDFGSMEVFPFTSVGYGSGQDYTVKQGQKAMSGEKEMQFQELRKMQKWPKYVLFSSVLLIFTWKEYR